MRQGRRVAQFARKAGFGQAQQGAGQSTVRYGGRERPQKSLVGQGSQPGQADSDSPYVRNVNLRGRERGLTTHIENVIPHVGPSREADHPDVADRAKEFAAFDGEGCLTDAVRCLTEPGAERSQPSQVSLPPAREPWTERPDVTTVVEDLSDEGMRPGRISRELGLTCAEVITILRRTGR